MRDLKQDLRQWKNHLLDNYNANNKEQMWVNEVLVESISRAIKAESSLKQCSEEYASLREAEYDFMVKNEIAYNKVNEDNAALRARIAELEAENKNTQDAFKIFIKDVICGSCPIQNLCTFPACIKDIAGKYINKTKAELKQAGSTHD